MINKELQRIYTCWLLYGLLLISEVVPFLQEVEAKRKVLKDEKANRPPVQTRGNVVLPVDD